MDGPVGNFTRLIFLVGVSPSIVFRVNKAKQKTGARTSKIYIFKIERLINTHDYG
jgi:hypothetical protein